MYPLKWVLKIVTGGKVFAIALGIIGIFALKEMLDLKTNQNSIPFFMKSISQIKPKKLT